MHARVRGCAASVSNDSECVPHQASGGGFSLSLLPEGAGPKGGRAGAGATHSNAAAADPSSSGVHSGVHSSGVHSGVHSGGSIDPAPAEADQEQTVAAVKLQAFTPAFTAEQEQTDAAVKLQARVRGRRVRRHLGVPAARSAVASTSMLGAPAARSAVVAWVAVDAEGGEWMLSSPRALLASSMPVLTTAPSLLPHR